MRLSHLAWNLTGLSLPLLVAAVSVPALIIKIGSERFGLLALAWGLIGYAGALDLGIGRALTQMVSRLRGEGQLETIPDVLATAGRITLVSGVIGGGLIIAAALGGAASWIDAGSTPAREIMSAMVLLAVALPAQAMSATYKGLNEAYQNFRGINILRVALGAVTFGGPFWVSQYTLQLQWLVATLVVSRLLALVIYRYLAMSCLKSAMLDGANGSYKYDISMSLLSFGGWITVSSIVSPMLVQADRFVIASIISAAAVTVYVLPYEVVVQSLIVTGAISSVIFPSLSKMIADRSTDWRLYFRKWFRIVVGIMAVVCATLAFILPELLRLWIGESLDARSVVVGQILCAGVFANSIGAMFYALHHAQGGASITARIHLIELPVFLVGLYFLILEYGVVGAALAWVGRMIFDSIALAYLSKVRYA